MKRWRGVCRSRSSLRYAQRHGAIATRFIARTTSSSCSNRSRFRIVMTCNATTYARQIDTPARLWYHPFSSQIPAWQVGCGGTKSSAGESLGGTGRTRQSSRGHFQGPARQLTSSAIERASSVARAACDSPNLPCFTAGGRSVVLNDVEQSQARLYRRPGPWLAWGGLRGYWHQPALHVA